MNIVIDARLYGLENAGLGRYVMNLVGELSKLDRTNSYSILLRKKYYEKLKLPGTWKKILADFRHYGFNEQIKINKIIQGENPDIAHFPHFNVPIFYRGKFIVTIHDLLMHTQKGLDATTLPPPLYYIKRIAYKTVFRQAVAKSKRIIVPSFAVKEEVEMYYPFQKGKVDVIYEGFDSKITPVANSSRVLESYGIKKPYFVYAGNAYPHKNLQRLVDATILLNRHSDQKIILAIVSSRDAFTKRLKKLLRETNVSDIVKLLGFVPDDHLAALYQNSVGLVFPSLSEGFGLPGLEAMSSGTPVLASNIPVFKEIYKDNAIYFNPLDFSSIEKSMKEVIQMESEERKLHIKKAQEFAKNYSWDKMAAETLRIYEEEGKKGSDSLRSGK